ncbi:sodium-dependent transporter [Mobilibacterium timonense]|uniref:sodium-dependent transporter n=1 Tax=Mobilibacterium timonense TaxID=1871012 RepID=UPI0009858D4B|nr:sodium-dependent transporter [Mobilibacterium timonense]
MEDKSRDSFGSRLGFIVSTIGFSVGVGTLWRFPYVCGTYGGGLYLLTYALFMIVIGIPLFTAEVSLGMASRQTPVKAYQKLSGKKPWGIVGLFNMLCIVMVAGYTVPVYGWVIHYIYATPMGVFKGMNSGQIAEYFGTFSSNHTLVIALILVNCVLTMLVVKNNLQDGIEKIGKVLLPSLVVIMVAIVIMGLRLPGASDGLKFLFSLDAANFSGESILSALGQTFFSLGIAMAVALTFGSYQKEGDLNALKNSTIVSCAVIFVAILAGMMIFPLTSAFGLDVQAGPGLTFIVMPNVFNALPGGLFWGTLFYIAFFIAAFSSGIAGWQAIIGFLMDQFGFGRMKAMFTTFLLVLVIGIPATLSDTLFNFFDMITNNIFLTAGAFFMSIFVGWIWGIDNFADTIGISKGSGMVKTLGFIIKFVAPLIIVVFSLSLFGLL